MHPPCRLDGRLPGPSPQRLSQVGLSGQPGLEALEDLLDATGGGVPAPLRVVTQAWLIGDVMGLLEAAAAVQGLPPAALQQVDALLALAAVGGDREEGQGEQ